MTEQRSPDEEPIIELTEVVGPNATDGDDIIELTDVVEPAPPEDEEVIELTEVVASPQVEEEILDLVDVVEETPPDEAPMLEAETTSEAEGLAEIETTPSELPEEDAVEMEATLPDGAAFDLFADTDLKETAEASSSEADQPEQDQDLDFAPMDLDIEESKEEDLFDSLGMKLEPDLQSSDGSDELDFNLSTQELSDAIDLLDAKLAEEPPADVPGETAQMAAMPPTISEAQLENALENVIRKMFAEKIDLLINEAIEKTVSAEIEQLKTQLLKDTGED